MTETVYSEEDAESAPFGHVRFAGTNVDVVAYQVGEKDLCILMNKDGVCVYRATLVGAFDAALKPLTTRHPFLEDTFIVHDLASAREEMEKVEREGGSISGSVSRGVTYTVHKPR